MQIPWITAGEVHRPEVVDVHVIEVGIDVLTQLEVQFRRHQIAETVFHIVIAKFTIGDGYMIHCHNVSKRVVLITERMRQAEDCLDIPLCMKSLGNAKVGSSQTAIYMRRILPSKH